MLGRVELGLASPMHRKVKFCFTSCFLSAVSKLAASKDSRCAFFGHGIVFPCYSSVMLFPGKEEE